MSNIFDDLKKFAITDILSVSGKYKTARVIENHMNNLIEVALIKGEQSKQGKVYQLKTEVNELKEMIDEAIHDLQHIESAMWEEQVDHVLMILRGEQTK